MRLLPRTRLRAKLTLSAAIVAGATVCLAATPSEAPFLAETDAAMTKMMVAMSIRPTGDVDRDFVAMMSAHHQGAIEMARAQLRYGRNERLRRLANEIIITQQQEITVMWLAIGEPQPRSDAPADGSAADRPAPIHKHRER